jgi:hypothetical protein
VNIFRSEHAAFLELQRSEIQTYPFRACGQILFRELFTAAGKHRFGYVVVKITFAENTGVRQVICLQYFWIRNTKKEHMFWTLELASYLEEAPWPATKDELIDYSIRSGAPLEVVENLQELDDEGEVYESIEDIWPDYPSQEDFMFNEDEY